MIKLDRVMMKEMRKVNAKLDLLLAHQEIEMPESPSASEGVVRLSRANSFSTQH